MTRWVGVVHNIHVPQHYSLCAHNMSAHLGREADRTAPQNLDVVGVGVNRIGTEMRSGAKGRQGIRIASAWAAACPALLSALPAVSIITRSASFARACCKRIGKRGAWAGTTAGILLARLSPQTVELARGSRSKIAVAKPCASAATARLTASVVFPAPPFSLMIAITFITSPLVSLVTSCLYNKKA